MRLCRVTPERAEGSPLRIYAVNVSEPLQAELQDELTTLCSLNRRLGLRRFAREEDARRSLMGEMLLRAALVQDWLPSDRILTFRQDGYGKPYLDGINDIHFNISHSGDWCVCAVSECPVGIDVEQIREQRLEWTNAYLSSEEWDDLRIKRGAERLKRFYEIWTRKESYVKCLGRGLSLGLGTFSVVGESVNRLLPYRLQGLRLDDLHQAAICTSLSSFPEQWQFMSVDQIGIRLLQAEAR
ncbi:4'-phosphopantetheinyl transferase family protein [Cohnella silvisoli]|uniref:4'-phosphopantetheinyl transferase superfamily protein n=1 Tax=Cohnella silvisoli TaxID=2873699 RepID=A0ABV1L3E5_9BACL|nr:4'-phosphopantetheinyl transferase superfamily protein [Cohnella silvisoli]MCD9026223.1 4'-phosphopantetheinyl transferase superfamily protein [Cohnella silvisoli]